MNRNVSFYEPPQFGGNYECESQYYATNSHIGRVDSFDNDANGDDIEGGYREGYDGEGGTELRNIGVSVIVEDASEPAFCVGTATDCVEAPTLQRNANPILTEPSQHLPTRTKDFKRYGLASLIQQGFGVGQERNSMGQERNSMGQEQSSMGHRATSSAEQDSDILNSYLQEQRTSVEMHHSCNDLHPPVATTVHPNAATMHHSCNNLHPNAATMQSVAATMHPPLRVSSVRVDNEKRSVVDDGFDDPPSISDKSRLVAFEIEEFGKDSTFSGLESLLYRETYTSKMFLRLFIPALMGLGLIGWILWFTTL